MNINSRILLVVSLALGLAGPAHLVAAEDGVELVFPHGFWSSPKTRSKVEIPALTEEVLKDIEKAVILSDDGRSGFNVSVRDDAGAVEARNRLRDLFLAKGTLEEVMAELEKPVTLSVWDPWKRKYAKKEVPGGGTLLMLALSQPALKPGYARMIMIKNGEGKQGMFPITYRVAEPLATVTSRLAGFLGQSMPDGKTVGATHEIRGPMISSERPWDFEYSYDTKNKNFQRLSHQAEADKWDVGYSVAELSKDEKYREWTRSRLSGATAPKSDAELSAAFAEAASGFHEATRRLGVRPDLQAEIQKELEAKLFDDAVPWSDIGKLVSLQRYWYNGVTATPSDSDEASAIRKELLSGPDAWKLRRLIESKLGESATMNVWNTAFQRWEKLQVDSLGSVLAAALSQRTLNQFDGRQLLFRNKEGEPQSLYLMSSGTEPLVNIRAGMKSFFDPKEDRSGLALGPGHDYKDRPPVAYFTPDAKTGKYNLISNTEQVTKWDVAKVVTEVGADADLKKLAIDGFQAAKTAGKEANPWDVALSESVSTHMNKKGLSADLRPMVEEELARAVKRVWFAEGLIPGAVKIERQAVTTQHNSLTSRPSDPPLIAFVGDGFNLKVSHTSAAWRAGAAEVHYITNNNPMSQMLQKIKQAFKKYGKIRVSTHEHANNSYQPTMGLNYETVYERQQRGGWIYNVPKSVVPASINQLVDEVAKEQMVDRWDVMGCNYGGGMEGSHLAKLFASRGIKMGGVTPQLSCDSSRFFASTDGHYVTAVPDLTLPPRPAVYPSLISTEELTDFFDMD